MSNEPHEVPEPAPAATESAPASAKTMPAAEQAGPARPRTGPIVWGTVILAFCAYITQRTLAPGTIDTATWAIASVVGLGLLLLIVGIAVIVRGSRRSRDTR